MSEKSPIKPRRVIPRGDPIDWTREDVARLAEVSDGDKLDARRNWRDKAPRATPQADGVVGARDLIDARPRKRKGER